jgi:hypothetical protein
VYDHCDPTDLRAEMAERARSMLAVEK